MIRTTLTGIIAAIALTTASAGQATSCWNGERLAAARVAEFNTAMMVTTLRCSLINIDIKASYDAFIVNYKTRLQGADNALKRQFDEPQGGAGEKNYHQFYTQIGNRYGAAKTDSVQCALFSAVAAELAKSGSNDEMLDKYAFALVPNPAVSGERCAEMAARP
ncbi:MAG TPA: hypothetical protein VF475_17510 [Sphingobium sp.]